MKYSARFERWWENEGRVMFDGGVRYKWAAYEAWKAARRTTVGAVRKRPPMYLTDCDMK